MLRHFDGAQFRALTGSLGEVGTPDERRSCVSNLGGDVQQLYLGLQRVFEDLNRLGRDFNEALKVAGLGLSEREEYSHSPATFEVKKAHTWMSYRPWEPNVPLDKQTLAFGAAYAYFEADAAHKRWKVTAAGRPELWFFLGTVTPPPTVKLPSTIRTFFDKADLKSFNRMPQLDGVPVGYEYRGDQRWDAVALGVELDAVQSMTDLQTKVISPLVEAAKSAKLALWE